MLMNLYTKLEENFPTALKHLIPTSWRIWLGYQVKVVWQGQPPPPWGPVELDQPLTLPAGETLSSIYDYLARWHIKEDGPSPERIGYLDEALKRFLYTLQLVPPGSGKLLEIGGNPYFLTLLLQRFSQYEVTCTNYFAEGWGKQATQTLIDTAGNERPILFDHFNLETERFPYADASFDVILLCEVLEHLTNDPQAALLEIKRVLKPNGTLILTTPNAARLQHVVLLLKGHNIFDQYSAYGPYGRHNREYTQPEVVRLLEHLGFQVEVATTADIHPQGPYDGILSTLLDRMVQQRRAELGHYQFIRARNVQEANWQKPSWLYRSYPATELT
jgi:SAM-dependent methyltransferase